MDNYTHIDWRERKKPVKKDNSRTILAIIVILIVVGNIFCNWFNSRLSENYEDSRPDVYDNMVRLFYKPESFDHQNTIDDLGGGWINGGSFDCEDDSCEKFYAMYTHGVLTICHMRDAYGMSKYHIHSENDDVRLIENVTLEYYNQDTDSFAHISEHDDTVGLVRCLCKDGELLFVIVQHSGDIIRLQAAHTEPHPYTLVYTQSGQCYELDDGTRVDDLSDVPFDVIVDGEEVVFKTELRIE